MEEEKEKIGIEKAIKGLFQGSLSSTGEEEMLRIASTYSQQITAPQIRLLLFLKLRSLECEVSDAVKIDTFVREWLELKRYNNSAPFVMRALESISLRRFINENTMKVNVQK
jgi:hypothetical protein